MIAHSYVCGVTTAKKANIYFPTFDLHQKLNSHATVQKQ